MDIRVGQPGDLIISYARGVEMNFLVYQPNCVNAASTKSIRGRSDKKI